MKGFMVYLTTKQHEALRKLAFEKRSSISEEIRKAVDKHLKEEDK